MSRRIRIAGSVIFLVLWLGLLGFGRSSLLRDPGTFWHVAAGERMLCEAGVLHADLFSFTRAGRPWVAHQWLAECLMAAVFRWCGWDGLLVLSAAVLAAVYAWLAGRLFRVRLHPLPALVLLGMALAAGSPQFHARPLIVSLGLVGLTFAWLIEVEQRRRPLSFLWWLVPLVILWANLHGGVLAGLGMLGLAAAGWQVAWVCGWKGPITRWTQALQLVAVVLCCLAGVLVNPYGTGLPAAWWHTLRLPLPELIQEHAPLDLHKPPAAATVGLAVLYGVVLWRAWPAQRRITWLVPLVLLLMAFQRVRHAPLFAITALVGLADMLTVAPWNMFLERRGWLLAAAGAARRDQMPGRLPFQPAFLLAGLLPGVAVVGALAIQAAGMRVPLVGCAWAKHDPKLWPVELLSELKAIEQAHPPGTPIFNDLAFGGFLIFHTPRLRVFVDDRCALYGGEFLRAYDRARRTAPEQLEEWQRRYGFQYALVETNGGFDRYLHEHQAWKLLGRTGCAALYGHSAPELAGADARPALGRDERASHQLSSTPGASSTAAFRPAP